MRLLVIEDYSPLRESLCQFLGESGYVVDAYSSGDEGLWAMREHSYDLALLDLMLPKVDGMTILRKVREAGQDMHVLVISARDGLEDRLEALDAGADDFLVKPFHLAEVLARVRALLRRSYGKKQPLMTVGSLELDPMRRQIRRAGQEIELTALEYRLLEYLTYRTGQVVSRTEIWEHVFEDETGGSSNAVDVYIGYLRKKLKVGNEPELIWTKRGQGYLLESPEQ